MNFLHGFSYHFRGLRLAARSPRLLLLGLLRFAVVVLITIACAALALYYRQAVTELFWSKPASPWIVWLWHLLSGLVTLLLVGVTTILAYLIAQLLFSVWIMDVMSRITERMAGGAGRNTPALPPLKQFFHLVRQEIPRTTLPVLLFIGLMVLGWATPLAPLVTLLSPTVAVIFLAWDNTDLVPARRMLSFSDRFGFLLKNLGFHLGFGLPFLIPGLNVVLLSYAPVGATLYYIDQQEA